MRQLIPGYGAADPARMKKLRGIAKKAERFGKFEGLFRATLSYSFFMRRLPTVFMPPAADVAAAQKLSGKSYFRQCLDRLILFIMFRQEPSYYYVCALFMPERYSRAGEFIDHRQISFLNFLLNQRQTTILTEDKIRFSNHCHDHNLRTIPIIGRLVPNLTSESELKRAILPTAENEGVFFKPRFGMMGQGAGRLTFDGQETWSIKFAGGNLLEAKWPEIFRLLTENVGEELIFQPLLKSHPALAKFNPDSIQSIRFITFRDGENIRPLVARLRLGIGDSLVDTSHAAIGVPIDLTSKKLTRGGQKTTAVLPESITNFGPQYLPLEGFEIPFFDEVQTLAINVHKTFDEIFSLGHDIFILADGPAILETNHIWGNPEYAHASGLGTNSNYVDGIIEIAKSKGL